MADFTDHLTEDHQAFIARQPLFFVATAAADGRINLSPKGYDVFRILDPDRVVRHSIGGPLPSRTDVISTADPGEALGCASRCVKLLRS